jgi:hypothetical protein
MLFGSIIHAALPGSPWTNVTLFLAWVGTFAQAAILLVIPTS